MMAAWMTANEPERAAAVLHMLNASDAAELQLQAAETPPTMPFATSECFNDDTGSKKSDYENLRARNIERNNARLRALGLISQKEQERSNALARGKVIARSGDYEKNENGKREPKKKRPRKDSGQHEASRKSMRQQGLEPEGSQKGIEKTPFDTREERRERVQECREVRLRAAKAVAEAGAEKAAKENPTATYEHSLMRVRSMTDKALANRVRAIERAAGKHCAVKMAIFKSCLQDEGMWELARLASEALERLKGLQPLPEE